MHISDIAKDYSDTNPKNIPLREALQSKMLKTIRENHAELKEIQGCACGKNANGSSHSPRTGSKKWSTQADIYSNFS
jgi:hypothetical protein